MFTGFNEKTTDFLWAIRFNNNREWFLDNKRAYIDNLQRPMNELTQDVYEIMTIKHNLNVDYHVSRIYRDARRIRSGGPYKDRLWFSLREESPDWAAIPVFFFEIEPEGYSYGMGYYIAPPATMLKFRKRLDKNPGEFEEIATKLREKKIFSIYGDEYKKPKGKKEGILSEWYNRRNIGVISERSGHKELYSPGLVQTLCGGFEALIPLYNFLWSLERSD